jgi:hypothetical protein
LLNERIRSVIRAVISDRLEVVVINRVRVIKKVVLFIKEEGLAVREGDRSKIEGFAVVIFGGTYGSP